MLTRRTYRASGYFHTGCICISQLLKGSNLLRAEQIAIIFLYEKRITHFKSHHNNSHAYFEISYIPIHQENYIVATTL